MAAQRKPTNEAEVAAARDQAVPAKAYATQIGGQGAREQGYLILFRRKPGQASAFTGLGAGAGSYSKATGKYFLSLCDI